jgi:uncharacterized protein YciI
MYYLLTYDLVEDYFQRRAEDGDEHIRFLWDAYDRKELILGGALLEPVDQGVYLFKGDSPAVAEQFAQRDSYVRRGFVKSWKVRPWMIVAGDLATIPRPPAEPGQ